MSEEAQNLQQQVQQQTMQSAQDFFGASLGSVKGRIAGDRAQLEELAGQLPDGDAQAQIQEMVDSYNDIEGSLDRAAQDQELQDTVDEAAQQEQGGDEDQQ